MDDDPNLKMLLNGPLATAGFSSGQLNTSHYFQAVGSEEITALTSLDIIASAAVFKKKEGGRRG